MKTREPRFEPRTLGEHLNCCRLERKLSREAAARVLTVNPWTVLNWECGRTQPSIAYLPRILRFLGYNPFAEPKTLQARLLAKRQVLGWSIKEAAKHLGVDERTLSGWERTGKVPRRRLKKLLADFLRQEEDKP